MPKRQPQTTNTRTHGRFRLAIRRWAAAIISAAGPPACEERDYAESKTHASPAVARFRALSTASLCAGIGLAAAVAQAADGRVPVPTPLPAKIEAIRMRIQGLPKEERRAALVEILGEPTSAPRRA